MTKRIPVATKRQVEMIDITSEVQAVVQESGINEGYCLVYVPHTTCGITINENADPDVQRDIVKELNKIIPFEDNYTHMEGNSAAHIKSSLMGFSAMVPVLSGRLSLGTWQGIYLFEFDGGRSRSVTVQVK